MLKFSLILLFLLFNPTSAFIEKCYEGTRYWSGKKIGTKSTCDPETKYCYILMGSSATSPTSTRGCAPDYIDSYCEKYRTNPSAATEFCFSVKSNDMNGKLCCCNSHNNCNLAFRNPIFIPLLLTFSFYFLNVFLKIE